jgi:hypothetical protein
MLASWGLPAVCRFCRPQFGLSRGLATKSYPPPSPLFEFPVDDVLKTAFVDVSLAKDAAISAQRRYDSQSVFEYFRLRLGFTSNKIEGNSFSEEEVFKYLKTGVTIGGKPIRDHLEIEGHDRALRYTFDFAEKKRKPKIDIDFVLKLHKICMPPARQVRRLTLYNVNAWKHNFKLFLELVFNELGKW